VLGHRPSLFAAEQWLRADADGRKAGAAVDRSACDQIGCVGILPDGSAVALVLDKAAFAEDCRRASVIVTPLLAPKGCAAALIIDHDRLAETGAVTLRQNGDHWQITAARSPDEDRPWSPAPKRHWKSPALAKDAQAADADAPMDASDAETSPLD